MGAIVGYIDNTNRIGTSLLSDMIRTVRWTDNEQVDLWHDVFLSIARLNHGTTNTESQPIFNNDRSMLMIMDGNIFDYEQSKSELINKGHRFEFEHNDAEYCLRLYEETGESAFRKLNGNFNIVVYNLITHELLLVNDRFCSQPLFYYLTDKGNLLFGTRLSSILVSPEVPRQLDIRSIFEFFTFQRILGNKTYYKDIDVLKPAHILKYQNGNVSIIPYWEMHYKETNHPKKYYVDKLAAVLKKSVARRIQGNNCFGLLLSGGLDSRMILAASDKKMVTFTFGDFENREVKTARKIAEAKGCKHIFLNRDFDHYFNMVDEAVESGDGMYNFIHAHVIGYFSDIQEVSDVIFTGVRFEHCFRGTALPRRTLKIFGRNIGLPFLTKITDKNIVYKILGKLRYSIYEQNPHQLFNEYYADKLDDVLNNSIKKILEEANSKVVSIYDKFTWLDTYYTSRYPTYLFNLSIRQALDEYVVMFDNDLFDLYLEIPLKYRSNKDLWIATLEKLNPDIARIPNSNTGYSPFFPTFIRWAVVLIQIILKKIFVLKANRLPNPTYTESSWPNYRELIRHNKKLRELIWITITDPECLDPSLFDIRRIKEMFEAHVTGEEDYSAFLYLLLTFGSWHKKYGPHKYSTQSMVGSE